MAMTGVEEALCRLNYKANLLEILKDEEPLGSISGLMGLKSPIGVRMIALILCVEALREHLISLLEETPASNAAKKILARAFAEGGPMEGIRKLSSEARVQFCTEMTDLSSECNELLFELADTAAPMVRSS
jgi:hypothetical protein